MVVRGVPGAARWSDELCVRTLSGFRSEGKHSDLAIGEMTHVPHQQSRSVWWTLVKKSAFKIYFYSRWSSHGWNITSSEWCARTFSSSSQALKTICFFLHVIEFGFFPSWSFAPLKKRNSREEIVHYSLCSRSVMEFSTDEETLLTESPRV